jgi:hypothetical protein
VSLILLQKMSQHSKAMQQNQVSQNAWLPPNTIQPEHTHFFRQWGKNTFAPSQEPIKFSTCIRPGCKSLFFWAQQVAIKVETKGRLYVVCVQYANNVKGLDDVQPVCTGKIHRSGETIIDGTRREGEEELGLQLGNPVYGPFPRPQGTRTYHNSGFIVDSNTKLNDAPDETSGDDDLNSHVQALVVGTLEDLGKLYSEQNEIFPRPSGDTVEPSTPDPKKSFIVGVRLIALADVFKFLENNKKWIDDEHVVISLPAATTKTDDQVVAKADDQVVAKADDQVVAKADDQVVANAGGVGSE